MAGIDDNGSVMEEMMALFTPPGRGRETKSNHKKLELHPYYKRPGMSLYSNVIRLMWSDWALTSLITMIRLANDPP